MKRKAIFLVLFALLLSALACGVGGPLARRNNEIRRAALAHELATRGPVDEVLVAFGLSEVRDNLGFEGGNTVWLNWFAEDEYFRKRDPDEAYLFLHDLNYADGAASIVIDRGKADSLQSYRLTLRREEGVWTVVSEEPLASPATPSD